MILRRVIEHVREQNWTAIGIDFCIVVIGVFVGIQVANWNEARAFDALERSHLRNLRTEIERDIRTSAANKAFYVGVSEAGERALAFLEGGSRARTDAGACSVDFFHASQWIDIGVTQTNYSEMRRIGLPRSRPVAIAIEDHYLLNSAINNGANERPVYRTLVRGRIPVRAQQAMWKHCHGWVGGIETFNNDCPAAIPMPQAERAVETIRSHPDILPSLTQWTATSVAMVKYLGSQNEEAGKVLAAIDRELGVRP